MIHGRYMVSRGVRDQFFTEHELRAEARSGLLRPQDLVFHPLLGRWMYAREVAELEQELCWIGTAADRPREAVALVPVNQAAVAGLILAVLGHLPILGLVPAGLGLYFSGRGLRRAPELYGSGRRLALAGLLLSLCFFVPQLCAAALLLRYGGL